MCICPYRLKDIPGSSVEHNIFCVSAHFRNCPGETWQEVVSVVEEVVSRNQELRITRGRKVVEIRPKVSKVAGSMLHGCGNCFFYCGQDSRDWCSCAMGLHCGSVSQ